MRRPDDQTAGTASSRAITRAVAVAVDTTLPLVLRAVERGQLPPDTDLELAIDQLLGPIHYRVLVTGQPVHREFTDALADRFLKDASPRR
jgi:hypothetical protein